MKTFTRAELPALVQAHGQHLVSIYLPMFTGAEFRQNRTRFKNLLRAAEDKLKQRGLNEGDARELLKPAAEQVDQSALQAVGQSIAVFIDAEKVRVWHLPIECEESCIVGTEFHVTPLVVWLNQDAPYHVLAVSQNQVRFFAASRTTIEERAVPGMPANMDAALLIEDVEPTRQGHVGDVGGNGLMVHGHGGAPDAIKPELLTYFHRIDRALQKVLRQKTEPLVFAGVDYLFPIYQEANTYPHLLPKSITGNPEIWSPAEILQRAWPLVEPTLAARRAALLARYAKSVSADRASHDVDEILMAAEIGAVDVLFVDPAARLTGRYTSGNGRTHVDEQAQRNHHDLIDLAVGLVLRNSGAVETLAAADIPGGGPMAAILRYPFAPLRETIASGETR